MFVQALRVAVQLALFRGGPQDMPYSIPLTRAAVGIAVVCSMLLLSPMTPMALAFATGIGGAAGLAFFTRQLLKGRKLDARFAQTLTSQLLVGSLFALAMWPASMAMAPAMLEMMEQMRAGMAAQGAGAAEISWSQLNPEQAKTARPPAWAALYADALFLWSLVASVRINRLAADLGGPSSWLLTILSLFVLMGFVLLAQLVVSIFLV